MKQDISKKCVHDCLVGGRPSLVGFKSCSCCHFEKGQLLMCACVWMRTMDECGCMTGAYGCISHRVYIDTYIYIFIFLHVVHLHTYIYIYIFICSYLLSLSFSVHICLSLYIYIYIYMIPARGPQTECQDTQGFGV